jgi:hypothetical protein
VAVTVSPVQADSHTDQFERYSLAGFKHIGGGKAQIVNNPRKGNYAARLSIGKGTKGRSQLLITDDNGKPRSFENGKHHTISFSNRLDPSWKDEKRGEIVFNIHKRRGKADRTGKQPVSLYVRNGRWILSVRGDANPASSLKTMSRKSFDLGPAEKGKWNDWKIDYKPSTGQDGEIRVWKNGQEVVNHKGPNAFAGEPGYAAFGVYRPKGKAGGNRVIDYDEVNVGGDNEGKSSAKGNQSKKRNKK